MTESTHAAHAPLTGRPPRREQGRVQPTPRARRHDLWGTLSTGLLLGLIWWASREGWLDSRSDLGYWLGVAGGSMMVLLFAYPLRKRWALLARVGHAKQWFVVHMVLGILGPLAVLAHSAFRIGSMNAGVALFTMLVVAASGVVGRFIYLRIHRELGGERESLQSLQIKLGLTDSTMSGGLDFAPAAQQRLRDLERHAGQPGDRWREHLARLSLLPLDLAWQRHAIRRDVAAQLLAWSQREQWDGARQRGRLRKALRLVDEHIDAVKRVAQFAAYTRIFSLWHVLHVPFVFMMVICAIAHVVAVHAY